MIEYLKITSGSIDKVEEEPLSSFSVEPQPSFTPKMEGINKEKRLDSSDIKKSVCFFMYSGSALPDKPPILQENVLEEEKWRGRILEVEKESLVLDLRNEQKPENRLRIRVRKDIVEGNLERINYRTSAFVSYQRVRNYQGIIEKRVSIRLREPAEMPEEILEKEFEARMKRFSYMFSDK